MNNPLQQYFRRPAIYIKLPSDGRYYSDGILSMPENHELPVYPMTAIDEITAKTPDALFNGQAVVDIIQSCLPHIKDAWKINVIDLNALLIAIRVASVGEKMEVSSKCPNCSEESAYDVDLIALLQSQINCDYESPLVIGELTIKYHPLTFAQSNKHGLMQYDMQKMLFAIQSSENEEENARLVNESVKKLNDLTTEVIVDTIEYIATPEQRVEERDYIKEYLLNCDRKHSKHIMDHGSKLRESNQLPPLHFKCMHCEHEYDHKLILNLTDFFG